MKQRIIYTGILALLVGMASQAQAARLGIHGAYSNGGNVEESEIGFGGQLELPINPILSVELAVTKFSDEIAGNNLTIDQDLTSVGLSAVFRKALGPQLEGYMLFGANYNSIDTDISFTNQQVANTINSNMELDDELGFHIGGGLNFVLTYNMELFTEYRYTFLETENETALPGSEEEYQYDFGLAKMGLNFLF